MANRTHTFIRQNAAWSFHPTREKTRRACIEILGRVPPSVRDFIIDSKRLLLIAPGVGLMGTVQPYAFDVAPAERTPRFQIVVLAPELERFNLRQIVGFTVKCLAAAFRASGETPRVRPEDLAVSWGFSNEVGKESPATRAFLN